MQPWEAVHTREPDDGPDDDADNPPDPVDDESRDVAPDGSGTDDVSDVPPMEGDVIHQEAHSTVWQPDQGSVHTEWNPYSHTKGIWNSM